MSDLSELYRIKNKLLRSSDPEEELMGRLINTIIIAKDKQELIELSEVLYRWIKGKMY